MLVAVILGVCLFSASLLESSASAPSAGSCVCLTGNGVNIRSSACGGVIGSASRGQCYKSLGAELYCTLGSSRYGFWKIDYNGRSGWAAKNYLQASPGSNCGSVSSSGCSVVSRSSWGARSATGSTTLSHPTLRVFVHHTAASSHYCTTRASCDSKVRSVQDYHMNTKGWSDIGYNFLISAGGQVYEGRGWDRVGAHVRNWNSVSLGISMMGEFTSSLPTAAARTALTKLINCGVQMGKLSSAYKLHGHRDKGSTSCPGDRLYSYVQTLPRYSST